MGVLAPLPPGHEKLALYTPTASLAKRLLYLYVRCEHPPEQKVGLQCPTIVMYDGHLVLRTRLGHIDNGVMGEYIYCIAHGHVNGSDNGHTRTTQLRQITVVELSPYLAAL